MRWWEHYFVRYLVGTVAGAAVIVLLVREKAYKETLAPLLQFKDAEFLGVSLILAAGFAYCYIASAPILALHALRAHLRFEVIKKQPVRHVVVLVCLVGLLVLGGIVWHQVSALVYWLLGVLLAFQLGLIALAVFSRFDDVESFYRLLATRRSQAFDENKEDKKPSAGSEYVTSYRHLREHGNAVLIVLLEAVLAIALLSVPNELWAVYVIGIWLIPAAFTWFVGTVLESRFVSKAV